MPRKRRYLTRDQKLFVIRRYLHDGLRAWDVARELGPQWGQADIYSIVRRACRSLGIRRTYRRWGNKRDRRLITCNHSTTFDKNCRKCVSRQRRKEYYRSKGQDEPLPIPYQHALKPIARRYRAIRNKVLGVRIVDILNAQEPMDRAAYILLDVYDYQPEDVSYYLKEPPGTLLERSGKVNKIIRLTEHQNMYKDWPLVQQLIDEGCSESEVKEMIGIGDTGWNAAKRRGDVRV